MPEMLAQKREINFLGRLVGALDYIEICLLKESACAGRPLGIKTVALTQVERRRRLL